MFADRRLQLALVSSLLLTSAAASVAAPSPRTRGVRVPPIELEINEFDGYDPELKTTDDLEPFLAVVGDAAVAGFGESWHASGGYHMLKDRLFRALVEKKGFRAFGLETNWEATEKTNAFVQSCNGSAVNAARNDHFVWQSTEYADMIDWMCRWNVAHPTDRVTLFGFDIQQPDKDGPALAAFVTQAGMPSNDARVVGLQSCEKAFGLTHPFGEIPPAVHATCLDAIAGIENFLQSNKTEIIKQNSANAFDIAMLRVVGLRANQEQVFYIRDDFAKGFNHRDAGMAYAFRARRAMKAPGAKTMLSGDNVHVAQNLLPNGEFGLGAHLEAELGPQYVSFGVTAYQTEVPKAPAVCGFAPRTPGSVEDRLVRHGHDALFARPRPGTRQEHVLKMGYFTYRPFVDFDGIFFLAHSPSVHPLYWPHCR